jgi:hypothetical protein
MTDLTKVYEDFKDSKVILTNEFWREQNKIAGEMNKKFEEENRELNTYKFIVFTI